MRDLFAEPLVPGLTYIEDFIGLDEEVAIIGQIESLGLAPFRFQGWLGKRLTRSFGWRYDFDDASFVSTEPVPEWLLPLRERAAEFAKIRTDDFAHALAVRYDPGAGIGWHRDRPVFDQVVGVSLGAPAILRLRQRTAGGFKRASVPLEPRSAYLLTGEVRHDWEHSIAPGDALRFSITFRSLSDLGRAKAGT
jgi:alkylated DNA repair dioxygenase AlkB